MLPRRGRPTIDPKCNWTGFRLSDNDIEKLSYCANQARTSKADIVRKGIEKIYNELSTCTKDGD